MKYLYTFSKTLFTFCLIILTSLYGSAQTTLNTGDISIIGFNSALDYRDGFAFVTWVPLEAGTQIRFTDNGFNSSAHSNTSGNIRELEQTIHWTATSAIAAGTVIVIEANGSSSLSTITSHGSVAVYNADGAITAAISLTNTGDQIFAFQGSYTVSNNAAGTFFGTLIDGIGFQGLGTYTGWLTDGTVSSNRSYRPSDLPSSNALYFANGAVGAAYTGPRSNLTIMQLKAAVANITNWTLYTNPGGVQQYNTSSFEALSAPAITGHPSGSTICQGGNTTFSVTATGATTYQWQVSTNNGMSFENLNNDGLYSGVSTATLTITEATVSLNNNLYRCIASGAVTPAATSNNARLTVLQLPTAAAQPENAVICSGSETSITLSADLQGTSFTWTHSVTEGSVSGGSSGEGNTIAQALQGEGVISYVITPTLNNCTGAPVTVTVGVAPAAAVTTPPTNQSTCPNEEVSFTTEVANASSYQWQVNTGSEFENLTESTLYSGVTTNSLTISEASAGMNGYLYRVIVNSNCPHTITSQPVTLTATDTEEPVFISCPEDIVTFDANYVYEEPAASDNCTDNPTIELSEGLGIGATFPAGTTTETYTASDVSGNIATCSFTVTVELITSFDSQFQAGMNVHPNPARNNITIHLSNNSGPVEIQWHTLSGQLIETLSVTDVKEYLYDINHLSAGVYLLHVISSQEHHIQKILVK